MASKLKRRFRKTAVTLLVLYCLTLIVVFATHLPDRLIITPAPGILDTPGATQLFLETPNGKLEVCAAVSSQGKSPALYVLFFVGNEDRVNLWTAGVARVWEQSTGLVTEAWGVNLPGFGLSAGPAYLGRIGPAALAAFDALQSHAGSRPIVVQAASLGTLAALCVSAHRPIAGMTIQDPPPLGALVMDRNGWWNGWLLSIPIALSLPSDINSVANAARSSSPCVFITSGEDTVIPPPYQQRIISAYGGAKRQVILPGARHCSQPNEISAAEIALDRSWLLRSQVGH